MTHYPYLDLAVMDDIRELVISTRAAMVIDHELTRVFWANGEGATLLGIKQINDVLEADLRDHSVMRRQIVGAVERLRDKGSVNASMRMARGWKTRLVNFQVSDFTLPDGKSAILLVTEKLHGRMHSFEKMAISTISSLAGSGYVSAVLDDQGEIIAASDGYNDVAVERALRNKLVIKVGSESDRLVKRMVTVGNGEMAAGIARLSDDPAIHLLILADSDEVATPVDQVDAIDGITSEHSVDNEVSPESLENPDQIEGGADKQDEETPLKTRIFSSRRPSLNEGDGGVGMERWYYRQPKPGVKPDVNTDASEGKFQENTAASENTKDIEANIEPVETSSEDHDIIDLRNQKTLPPTDLPLFTNVGTTNLTPQSPKSANADDFQFIAIARPTRFVWHMDKNNQFTSISPEFAKIIGPIAANIVGSKWEDISRSFGFDEDGVIAQRLARGDTWSGKSVLWPVQGTNLRVPVDLAGLPSFNQNKEFSGYHGFGTVRSIDTVIDEQETGLALVGRSTGSNAIETDEFKPADNNSITPFTDAPDADANIDQSDDTIGVSGDVSPVEKNSDSATIVNLTEQRNARAVKELSTGEKAAFKEIADKLSDDKLAETMDENSSASIGESQPGKPENSLEKTMEPASQNDDTNAVEGVNVKTEQPDEHDKKDSNSISYLPSAFAGLSAGKRDQVDTTILLNLPIPVLIFRDNNLLFNNSEFFRVTGYRDDQSLSADGGIDALLGAPDGQRDGLTTITHKHGHQIPVKAHLQSVPWDGGRALLLALREDTDFGKLEAKSAEENKDQALGNIESNRPNGFGDIGSRELSGILDTATDGVVVLSSDGKIRAINRAAEALFGYAFDAVKDEEFTKLFARESHRSASNYLAGLSENNVASLLSDGRELIGREKQGGLIPLFVTLGKLEESDNYCAVLRDITQWKKAEEDLVAARRQAELASDQKTDFLAKISHEIRTPLNAIIGFSEVMLEERFGKISIDRYREYLRDINRSGSHVLELVNDLLDISKIEAGKLELDFSEVKLNDIIAEGVALTQPQANRDHIIIRTSLSGAVPPVVADPRSVRQIILNLVSNAIKYTKSGGQVIVSTVYEETGEVVLRVRDTGIGMSESEITTALMPFRRVQTITHNQGEGTGLGLPLTKALVEANRAQFSIESTPGEGTLVEIYFPSTRVLTE